MTQQHIPRRKFIKRSSGAVIGGLVAEGVLTANAQPTSKKQGEFKNMETPDIIFVGAGINSLGAAYILSKQGWRVLVLDKNATPGGAVRTMELNLPGFKYDIGAMNLSLLFNSPFYAEHKEAFTQAGLRFVKADHSYGSVISPNQFLGISTDMDRNLREISKFAKADVDGWKQWRTDWELCAPTLFGIYGSPAAQSDPLKLVFGNGDAPPRKSQL